MHYSKIKILGRRDKMSDVHSHKKVKTRKEHKCEGCFEKIPKETTVSHYKGIWQGEFYDYYMCNPCDDYIDKYMREDIADMGFTPGEIKDYRQEMEVSI
jgi:hypothetical protein